MSDDSPLASTSPDALTALFEADPLSLSDADLMRLVVEFRRRRSLFASEEAAKALKPKAARPKPSATPPALLDKPASELSLDDLI